MNACLAVVTAIGIILLSMSNADAQLFAYSVSDWSHCTASCGIGYRTRTVECRNTVTNGIEDISFCSELGNIALEQSCSLPPCPSLLVDLYVFEFGLWSDCSASCGIGIQTRSITCKLTSSQMVVDLAFCSSLEPEPTVQECLIADCVTSIYYYYTGPWSSCSSTCGTSFRERVVECREFESDIMVSDDLCEDLASEVSQEICNDLPSCPADTASYEYYLTDYGTCSETCGVSYRTRDILCRDVITMQTVDVVYCATVDPLDNVIIQELCNVPFCDNDVYEYATDEWSECTATCGSSQRTRVVYCREISTGTVVDAYLCSGLTEPSTNEPCIVSNCPIFVSYEYVTGEFSECSASCGATAYRERTVLCRIVDTEIYVDVGYCTGAQPSTMESCDLADCTSLVYEYLIGEWSDCTATCGPAIQTRTVECRETVSSNAESVDTCVANGLGLVPTAQVCAYIECPVVASYSYVIGEWSACSVSCSTGTITRSVTCREVNTLATVDVSVCVSDGLGEVSTTDDCILEACPEEFQYVATDWSTCSVSCGNGFQTRSAICKQISSGAVVGNAACSGLTTLPTTQVCQLPNCPIELLFEYKVSEWSDCTSTCGAASRTRTVECHLIAANSFPVNEGYCKDLVKPTAVEPCSLAACPNVDQYQYFLGPFGPCTVTCGTGSQTRNATCVLAGTTTVVDNSFCNSLDAPVTSVVCNEQTCPSIEIDVSVWSACSSTCGFSTRSRTVRCLENTGVEIALYFCLDAGLTLPNTVEVCSELPTCDKVYSYVTGSWGSCSVTCASGVRSRSVTCEEVGTNVRVDNSFCAGLTAPESDEICTLAACPTYDFITGDWSVCSVTCGAGIRTRDVACQIVGTTTVVSSDNCGGTEQPISVELCTLQACTAYQYIVGEWGACSVTCASGIRSRSVTCVEIGTDVALDDGFCAGLTAPDPDEVCTLAVCPTYGFITGDWSACSVTCGAGIRTRDVACQIVGTTTVVSNDNCVSTEPPTSVEVCTLQACTAYQYIVGQWATCSVTCESGVRSRSVTCVETGTTVAVDNGFCAGLTAPVSDEICTLAACPTYDYINGDWSACSVTCGDGIRTRDVACHVEGTAIVVSSDNCGSTEQPTSVEVCSLQTCSAYQYFVGEWGTCPVTCGAGQRVRTVICIDTYSAVEVDISLCPGPVPDETQTCELDACIIYSYLYSAWTACSETCGDNAIRYRTATCTVDGTQDEADDTLCIAHGAVKLSTEENCFHVGSVGLCPFYAFNLGEFGECSVTCGTGQRVRSVICIDVYSDVEVDISLCPGSVPVKTQTCELDACLIYQYLLSEWSVCDCNNLIRSRAVMCAEISAGVAQSYKDDIFCTADGIIKPPSVEACVPEQDDCGGNWVTGEWSECSVTCADGIQSRNVYCTDKFDATLTVADSQCNSDTKPDNQQACKLNSCSVYNYQFYASTWSDCSATCDEGIQTRLIICTEFVNDILTGSVADTFCEGMERPSESQTCNLVACQGIFYAGAWGQCSVTCGCGVQTRVVECRLTKDKALTAVVEDRCTGTKPIVEQECRNAACPEPFDCGTTYSEESGVIYSPQYPMSYPNDLDCTVTIDLAADVIANVGSLVQIAITRFQLEDETNCKFDNLQINDGVVTEIFCGSMDALPYLITTSGSTVHLTLHTDATITDAGYIITYTAVQPSPAS